MWKMPNPFPRLKAMVRKPKARRPVPPAPDRPVSLKGFGPQVAMRLHRARRTAALAHKHESED